MLMLAIYQLTFPKTYVQLKLLFNIYYQKRKFYWLRWEWLFGQRLGKYWPKEPKFDIWSHNRSTSQQLDKPVFSVWNKLQSDGDGKALLTLGAQDSDNCNSDWVYTPQLDYYDVHLDYRWFEMMYMPHSAKKVFVNASHGKYNRTNGWHLVSCDLSKSSNVIFNIGKANETVELVLTPADYIRYNGTTDYNICYLGVLSYKSSARIGYVNLTPQFWRNHCLAYKIKNKSVGFASSKTPIKNIMDW
uniref:Peptidase A1 domain-containing protein n=1 Tax=Ditylenchus dipsaci TaxID=166011 RepID=A0A915CPL5_9BILA